MHPGRFCTDIFHAGEEHVTTDLGEGLSRSASAREGLHELRLEDSWRRQGNGVLVPNLNIRVRSLDSLRQLRHLHLPESTTDYLGFDTVLPRLLHLKTLSMSLDEGQGLFGEFELASTSLEDLTLTKLAWNCNEPLPTFRMPALKSVHLESLDLNNETLEGRLEAMDTQAEREEEVCEWTEGLADISARLCALPSFQLRNFRFLGVCSTGLHILPSLYGALGLLRPKMAALHRVSVQFTTYSAQSLMNLKVRW